MLTKRRAFTGAIAVVVALGLDLPVLPVNVMAQEKITEIIDASGDGAGNPLDGSISIAVDGAGNVYVTGYDSDNAFRITPAGTITKIVDASGDGTGNTLDGSHGVAVDGAGNVYVTGSDNVFQITPAGKITEIIDASGDGAGKTLDRPHGTAVDGAGNVYVTGVDSDNAFCIAPGSLDASLSCGGAD